MELLSDDEKLSRDPLMMKKLGVTPRELGQSEKPMTFKNKPQLDPSAFNHGSSETLGQSMDLSKSAGKGGFNLFSPISTARQPGQT